MTAVFKRARAQPVHSGRQSELTSRPEGAHLGSAKLPGRMEDVVVAFWAYRAKIPENYSECGAVRCLASQLQMEFDRIFLTDGIWAVISPFEEEWI
jgi:hypothetical protein